MDDATMTALGGAGSQPHSTTTDEGRFAAGTMLTRRYRIVRRLGKGGMGEVYQAVDLLLGQNVALKFLSDFGSAAPQALERFHNEVRVARQVSHPNVCRVYDIGEAQGSVFLSMEYVDGEDLASLLRRIGSLPRDKALEVARKLCAGLHAAHEKGVIHRDLKPGNVMLDGSGQVRITDFGLAAFAGQATDIRSGTPAYMAPEQKMGREVSIRSDLYALGVMLHELFTGVRPGQAATRAELDPAVLRVVERCLAEDPAQRPLSALAVAAALPGGDPLAAALAAGETPSPEIVAAAGGVSGMSVRAAVACAAGVVVLMAAWAAMAHRNDTWRLVGLGKSPEVMADRASEMARRLGYAGRFADTAGGIGRDDRQIEWLEASFGNKTRQRVMEADPPVIYFWWRASQSGLTPEARYTNAPAENDPAPSRPGDVSLRLSPSGKLLRLFASPEDASGPGGAPDWKLLFDLAGLDMARFQPVEPMSAAPVAADTRAAWTGSWSEAHPEPLRIEAAAWRGRPVLFEIQGPWTTDRGLVRMSRGVSTSLAIVALVYAFVLVASGIMSWRNLKAGRADVRGALWIFGVASATGIVSFLLPARYGSPVESIALLRDLGEHALYGGVLSAVLYLALEPAVRRRWPDMLITWSRAVEGRWSDPRVGRDIALGCLFGAGLAVMSQLNMTAQELRGFGAYAGSRDFVMGLRPMLGQVAFAVLTQIIGGTGALLLLLLVRGAMKRDWLAATITAAVFGTMVGMQTTLPEIAVPIVSLAFLASIWSLLRYGWFAYLVSGFFFALFRAAPGSLDTGVWYFPPLAFALAIAAGMLVYGLRHAVRTVAEPT